MNPHIRTKEETILKNNIIIIIIIITIFSAGQHKACRLKY